MPRPPKELDADQLARIEVCCQRQMTHDEVAAILRISKHTLAQHRKRNPEIIAIMERGYAHGKASLRAKLFELADKGNVAAAIFLAKNLLGYRDYFDNRLQGENGGPVELSHLGAMTSAERLARIKELADKYQQKAITSGDDTESPGD